MKNLKTYIIEKQEDKLEHWLYSIKTMYEWYCDNFKEFYDKNHYYSNDNYKYCDLIKGEVVADCSGFVGACLCYAGFCKSANKWNTKLGSFNHYKNPNVDVLNPVQNEHIKTLSYMADISDFKCVKLKDTNDLSEIRPGDILVKGSHVTIAADEGAKHLYDWGQEVVTKHKNYKLVDFYTPEDHNMTYPFRSYWRLNK